MFALTKRCALILFWFSLSSFPAEAQGWQHIGAVQHVDKIRDGVELTAGRAKIRITAFNETTIRVRVAPQGVFPTDLSWAIIQNPRLPIVTVEDSKTEVTLHVGTTTVIAKKSPLLINFADASGKTLLADEPSLPMAVDGQHLRVWKSMPTDENYYGLGD